MVNRANPRKRSVDPILINLETWIRLSQAAKSEAQRATSEIHLHKLVIFPCLTRKSYQKALLALEAGSFGEDDEVFAEAEGDQDFVGKEGVNLVFHHLALESVWY